MVATQQELLTQIHQELLCSTQTKKSNHSARQGFQALNLCQLYFEIHLMF